MAINIFHELNMPVSEEAKKRVIKVLEIDEYFDDMELTEEQKQVRKDMARKLYDKLLMVFATIEVLKNSDEMPDTIFISTQIMNAFRECTSDEVTVDENLENYLLIKSWELAERTVKHIEDEFYLSDDRATLVAENESSSIYNYVDDVDAINRGCTKKTWIAIRDKKTRRWHKDVDGKTIAIDDLFDVDGELMAYPHDINASEKNTANCRCSVSYS